MGGLIFSRPAAILFDLDGTLVDSVGDLADATNAMLAQIGLPSYKDDVIRLFVGNGTRMLVDRAIVGTIEGGAPIGQVDRALEIFRDIYRECCTQRTVLMPHAIETLQALAALGVLLCVVTNKPQAPSRQILDHFGLSSIIASIVGGDTLAQRKPHPSTAHEALRSAGLGLETHAWFVGDSQTDLRTARAAKMPAIIVRGGYNHGEPIESMTPPPDAIVNDLREILLMYRATRVT